MKVIEIAIIFTGILPYILLVIAILNGSVKQNFATWILWLALDCIMLRGIIVQNGSPILYSVFTFGTLAVTIVIVIKKQISWSKFESFVSLLVLLCMTVYVTSGAYTATIATTVALFIAGIPQIVDTYRNPHTASTSAYLFFTTSSFLSLIENQKWTVPDKLPQINSMVFCVIVMLLSLRKKHTHPQIL
jgi:hypothetical protein